MIELTGDTTADIQTVVDEFNRYQNTANTTQQLLISAYGALPITVTDGGFVGNTYTGQFGHGLGYPPQFLVFYQDFDQSEFFPLPFPDFLVTNTTPSVQYYIQAYVDNVNLYATLSFLDSSATQPFYPADTEFNVYFYIFSSPIPNT